MKCKFSHLKFNDVVTFSCTGLCNCGGCGTDAREQMDGRLVVYKGHSDYLDLFELVNPFYCPSCGKYTNGHAEICGSSDITEEFSNIVQISYSLPHSFDVQSEYECKGHHQISTF